MQCRERLNLTFLHNKMYLRAKKMDFAYVPLTNSYNSVNSTGLMLSVVVAESQAGDMHSLKESKAFN